MYTGIRHFYNSSVWKNTSVHWDWAFSQIPVYFFDFYSYDLKNCISSFSLSAISLSDDAEPARVVTVADSSCMEAPVSSFNSFEEED